MKSCKICNIEKPFNEFSIAKENKDGFNNVCKLCKCEYGKTHRKNNFNKISIQRKVFYLENRKRLLTRETYISGDTKTCSICDMNKSINDFNKNQKNKDGRRTECRLCQSSKQKLYTKNNSNKIKNYRITNKVKINKHKALKKKTDIQYRLQCNLRTRFCNAVKDNFKSGSAVSDLGCTIADFKLYIEKEFVEGMTWDNWGRCTWHLDHKIPLSKFDLTNRQELLRAVHYTNLQPMWAKENLEKAAKF